MTLGLGPLHRLGRRPMDAGKPDPEASPAPAADSLSQRLSAALGGMRLPQDGWAMAAAFGALIAAGPLLTLVGATLLAGQEKRASLVLEDKLAPRLQAEAAARTARAALANAAGRAAPGEVLELLAGVLPAEASLTRIERTADGGLELDVTGGDPDALRAAIRRAPEFAGMRNTSQRRSDAAMIVSMREDAR
ncbi:hypothetical protein P6144_09995 [Sphingomonas sp. HITSZ_GF]|uniref:hypothetical protein n=1 Tax=Sphingomonas sp. HITSZ_GF TaxID=3037247 RepID=UPI00240D6D92|nr:hypothetical protein [Sphingomonas sp. HITSZ_GF]MDG2533977.1 hypothetical protein [Sphingomonas sp. HITSZ_GF]